MSQTDIVERLRKGPMSDHHFNEAADTITQLRERLDAVEKERDKALRYGAPENSTALSHVKNPCTKHNQYWTTHSGGCMACRANDAEKERDQLRRSNERLEKEKAELCKQWQRQRFALNQIAWPESYNLKGLTVETCRHIARDTLQIGTLTAESGTEGKG